MSQVFVFGSGECDQLGLGDDIFEIKRPKRIPIFDTGLAARRILKVVCGGMHTVALSNMGKVYTWGCNDEGALGREGAENTPMEVANTLPIPATDICAGDSHTLAYNTDLNQVYIWGQYRNAQSGKTTGAIKVPTRIGADLFNKQKKQYIQKIASGAHHTLVLTKEGKIYGWGDAESGKIGRMLNTRNKDKEAMRIEKVGAKNGVNIFCGNHHSFYINNKGQVFGWGLNNHGQLGIGNKENTSVPTLIKKLEGMTVTMIAGGEHHTIAVTQEGKVYCWGRNDEAQCGLGDLYGTHKKKRAMEEYERMMKEEEEKQKLLEEEKKQQEEEKKVEEEKQEGQEENKEEENKQDEENKEENKEEEKKEGSVQKKATIIRKKKPTLESTIKKEEDLLGIGYFTEPQLVSGLWDELDQTKQKIIVAVYAKGNYCYALETRDEQKSNQLYSWGMGENYVLGTREDDNQFTPYVVHPKMFEELPVMQVGCGTQHVVVLTSDDPEQKGLPDFEKEVLEFQAPPEEVIKPKKEVKEVKESKKKEVKAQEDKENIQENRDENHIHMVVEHQNHQQQHAPAQIQAQPAHSQPNSKKRSRKEFEEANNLNNNKEEVKNEQKKKATPSKAANKSGKNTPAGKKTPGGKKTPSAKEQVAAHKDEKLEQQNVKRRKLNDDGDKKKQEKIEPKKAEKAGKNTPKNKKK